MKFKYSVEVAKAVVESREAEINGQQLLDVKHIAHKPLIYTTVQIALLAELEAKAKLCDDMPHAMTKCARYDLMMSVADDPDNPKFKAFNDDLEQMPNDSGRLEMELLLDKYAHLLNA